MSDLFLSIKRVIKISDLNKLWTLVNMLILGH